MTEIYNIYCDESCHLENDLQNVMVLGAVWCPTDKVHHASIRLKEIKINHGFSPGFEIKWTKVSWAKAGFYRDIIDYFFDNDDLYFRALIVPDKSKLRHEVFGQTHNEWYYKMYFDMLKVILNPYNHYRIYLDIKDTRGASKVLELHKILSNNIYDFSRSIIERVQTVRSHEVSLLQVTDLLIGAISYVNRGLSQNKAKQLLIERMRERSGYSLTRTTLLRENKCNIFRWNASGAE